MNPRGERRDCHVSQECALRLGERDTNRRDGPERRSTINEGGLEAGTLAVNG